MSLLEDDVAVNCSCSVYLALTFGVVQLWGIVSNSLILIILVKSQMIQNNIGKMLANEAVCDMLVNMAAGAMVIANLLERRIAVIGIPIIVSLTCVKSYCLLGLSFMLCVAICYSFKYRFYTTPTRVTAYCAFMWCFVPVVLLIIYLEGTYYSRKNRYEYLQVNYTSSNWWIGIFISVNAGILPFVGIAICVYKTLTYNKTATFPLMYAKRGNAVKIRLVKVSMLASVLHLVSLIPGQVVSILRMSSSYVIGFSYMLMFVYPSFKFFIYLHILKIFRKTAKSIYRRFCNRSSIIGQCTTSQSVSATIGRGHGRGSLGTVPF